MRIALIGYGAMGKIVERLAVERGHEIVSFVDETASGLPAGDVAKMLTGSDAAIDFTVAEAVTRNVEACVIAKVPVVVGTTGWNEQRHEIEHLVTSGGGAMVFGANFSIGVNLFYRIAEYAAELFAKFPEYEVFIEEQHHSRKKDAPSGTALKIKELISRHVNTGEIAATRAGNIPGTHRVGFDGMAEQILLEHTARTREGFAFGAILAAEWIIEKKGFYEFSEVMDGMLTR
ncbi:MAG: dihydrodipicolinate reductase [Acidobacteria bacterium]|nr:dihydrodipicolinate reductase [Acidobacteriota bacterium]